MTKNKEPKISIIMPNYNCERYIGLAIESMLNQTFRDFEFIIIDDGSTDSSRNIITKYAKKDKRIKPIKNKRNMGVHKTRNKLLSLARGEYIAMMDSDDISFPDRLREQITFLETNSDCSMCGTNFDIIDADGNRVGEKKFPETHDKITKSFFRRNPFGQNTILVISSIFDDIGQYDESLEVAEDLDMRIRIGAKHKTHNIQKNLVQYRIHGANSILTKQKQHIKNTLRIRKKAIKLGYKMSFLGRLSYLGTRIAQFLPPRIVLTLFNLLQKL